MGPPCHSTWFQDIIRVDYPSFISSVKSESIFFPVYARRDHRTSPETGNGKGTISGNSRLLFPAIPCTKEEWKVTSGSRSFIHKETTFQNGDSQISMSIDIGQRLDYLHRPDRCELTCSNSSLIQKVSLVHVQRSGLSVHGLIVRNVPSPSPWIFTNLIDVIALHLRQRAISVFPYLDDWLIKDLIRNRLIFHTKYCLQTRNTKSRFYSKFKEFRFDTSPEIHIYRDGISDTIEYSQGTRGPS